MGAKEDFIPGNDLEMVVWARTFATQLSAVAGDLDVTPAEVAAIQSGETAFADAQAEHMEKQTKAKAATTAKNCARAAIENDMRVLARRINQHPNMTNEIRRQLGLNPYKDGRSRVDAGQEVPGVHLEAIQGGVVVHCGSSPYNELRNGKPHWAMAINIYRRKAGEDDWTLLVCTPKSPYTDWVEGDAVQVNYSACYVAKRTGHKGTISVPVSIASGGHPIRRAA
jgi:hypothetical protein